jgi:hypothetical protein
VISFIGIGGTRILLFVGGYLELRSCRCVRGSLTGWWWRGIAQGQVVNAWGDTSIWVLIRLIMVMGGRVASRRMLELLLWWRWRRRRRQRRRRRSILIYKFIRIN